MTAAPDAALFRTFCALVSERAGITLHERREALVASRIFRRVRALGLRDAAEYLRLIETDRSGVEFARLLETISAHHPRFFRESGHFDDLAEAVRRWHDAGQRRFRLWSAAAATGEEAYSVGIAVLEALEGREADVRILATDPSNRSLRTASEGVYEDTAIAGLPHAVRNRYFTAVRARSYEERFSRVVPELRDLVVFKRLSLGNTPFPMRGPLDVVFCRDVLTYLERPVRERVVAEIDRLLRTDGLLFVGPSETLVAPRAAIVPVRTSVYRRDDPAAATVGVSA